MLTEGVGQVLPAALAVALSPIPIIAIVLILGTPRARTNGPAFAAGWVIGLAAVTTLVVAFVGRAEDADAGTSTDVNWFKVVIGVVFLVMAANQWRKRPKKGETATLPAWMASVDSISPGKSFGLGIALSAANPKNLALVVSASAGLANARLSDEATVFAAALLVVVGSVTVAGSVVFYLALTERATKRLASVKDFMARHNAVIMMVILLLLGGNLLWEGLHGAVA